MLTPGYLCPCSVHRKMTVKLRRLCTKIILFFVGLAVSRLWIQPSDPQPSPHCSQIVYTPPSLPLADFLRSRRNDVLLIGVMTTHEHLATRASAINMTWGSDPAHTIVYYVGRSGNTSFGDGGQWDTKVEETVVAAS